MELALAIFNVGTGIALVVVAGTLAYLAWRLTPLIRESRALTADLRRLSRTADAELRPIVAEARELTAALAVVTEDAAVKVERLGQLVGSVEDAVGPRPADEQPRPASGSVESWETSEGSW